MAVNCISSPFYYKWHSTVSPSASSFVSHSFRLSTHLNKSTFGKFNFHLEQPRIYSFPRVKTGYTEMTTLEKDENSSISLPPLPEHRIVVGCGTISTDYLASVAAFPQPDEKIRSTDLQVQGGGNVGNALTGAARLGLSPRIITKVANDAPGRGILAELEADGVDTSYIVVSETGNTPFTYVIIDKQMKTRTCIHSPGSPPMIPEDLSASKLSSVLTGARIVYFDGRLPDIAHVIAKEATKRQLPILVDAEREREGLDELLAVADHVVCSAKFPQAWTKSSSIASALVAMALRLPCLKFVIVTLGEKGCIMLERSMQGSAEDKNLDVNTVLESLQKKTKELSSTLPVAVSSEVGCLEAPGIGKINGRLLVGTAEAIPPSELVDTTGAGDGFIGAVLYAICVDMPPEKILPFAARVAAAGCRAVGARPGLPCRSDSRVISYLI
uniref:TSA: Wollemia nobilis Ref_Wollemi_Transcript_9726_1664 transcribed RNA sequence n=1 Tax=Wollemia nobilis TaxID=56998 RepID=A0A0C9RW44_9CONI